MDTTRTLARSAARNKSKASPFVVGIGGPTGSGKTTLARALVERYQKTGVCLLDQDSYYLDRSYLNEQRRRSLNFDEPSAFDHNLIHSHLESLLMGKDVEKPYYDFHTQTRTSGFELLQPAPLIIVEGIYAYWDRRIAPLMSLKIYVTADPDVRLIRRLRRDVGERGRSLESSIMQYLETVRPMQAMYIEPSKQTADMVVDTSKSFARPIAKLICAVAEHCPVNTISSSASLPAAVYQTSSPVGKPAQRQARRG